VAGFVPRYQRLHDRLSRDAGELAAVCRARIPRYDAARQQRPVPQAGDDASVRARPRLLYAAVQAAEMAIPVQAVLQVAPPELDLIPVGQAVEYRMLARQLKL
jgi:hypothetical protein